jgi:DNA ligase 1
MKPMLAYTVEDVHKLVYPVLASPKLDGIRCLIKDNQAFSRNFKLIPNRHMQLFLSTFAGNGLDGELIVGPPRGEGVFNRSTSGVMSRDGGPKFKYYVFDDFSDPYKPFIERLQVAKNKALGNAIIAPVAHKLIKSAEELLDYEAKRLLDGYEGVMVRDPNGMYKFGRSTAREALLGKVKRFEDSEAVIVGFVEQMENTNEKTLDELGRSKRSSAQAGKVPKGTLGTLEVRDIHNAVSFEIGTGLDDAQRLEIWNNRKKYMGKVVKYKSQPSGAKDKPRFPVFLGFRDKIDL